MKETLNRGYPYPEPTGDGADVSYWMQRGMEAVDSDMDSIAAAAESANARAPFAMDSGQVTINVSSGGNFGSALATFAPGRFTRRPHVTTSISNSQGGAQAMSSRSYSGDKDKCTIGLFNAPFSAGIPNAVSVTVDWIAVQMTAGA